MRIKKIITWLLTITLVSAYTKPTNHKVLVITSAFNRPDFIALQAQLFKKYLQDDYEFVVFNDASNEQDCKKITDICTKHNITCIRVPQEHREIGPTFSWASYRHAQAIEFMLQSLACEHNGIVMLIDSDLFLINNFSVTNYMKGYDIAGLTQGQPTTEYMWAGLMLFNMKSLPNKKDLRFKPVATDAMQLDSGGSMYYYFQENPTVKKRFFNQRARINLDLGMAPRYHFACPHTQEYLKCATCRKKNLTTKCAHLNAIFKELGYRQAIIDQINAKKVPWGVEFLLEDTFFHAVAGSGYVDISKPMLDMKDKLIKQFLQNMIS